MTLSVARSVTARRSYHGAARNAPPLPRRNRARGMFEAAVGPDYIMSSRYAGRGLHPIRRCGGAVSHAEAREHGRQMRDIVGRFVLSLCSRADRSPARIDRALLPPRGEGQMRRAHAPHPEGGWHQSRRPFSRGKDGIDRSGRCRPAANFAPSPGETEGVAHLRCGLSPASTEPATGRHSLIFLLTDRARETRDPAAPRSRRHPPNPPAGWRS